MHAGHRLDLQWDHYDPDRVLGIEANNFLIAPLMMLDRPRLDPVRRHLAQVNREAVVGLSGYILAKSNFAPGRLLGAAKDGKRYDAGREDLEMLHRILTLASLPEAGK